MSICNNVVYIVEIYPILNEYMKNHLSDIRKSHLRNKLVAVYLKFQRYDMMHFTFVGSEK